MKPAFRPAVALLHPLIAVVCLRIGILVLLALSLTPFPASADTITPTIPGANFSVPSVIGTFTFSLPPGSTINFAALSSPVFSFTPAAANFWLQLDIDGVGFAAFGMTPSDSSFSLGVVVDAPYYPLLTDGSTQISIQCEFLASPCPSSYTRVSGDWTLYIDYTPSPQVPEPGTFLLLASGLVPIARKFFSQRT